MGLGLGPTYWVHEILYFYGSLDDCIHFMLDHKPDDPHKWFEFKPDVHLKTGVCQFYHCTLVEMAKPWIEKEVKVDESDTCKKKP